VISLVDLVYEHGGGPLHTRPTFLLRSVGTVALGVRVVKGHYVTRPSVRPSIHPSISRIGEAEEPF
jgi:hypothetical protein